MRTAGDIHSAETRREDVQLCSVYVGGELFGIDTRAVREVLGEASVQRVPLAPQCIAGVVAYRGEMLTAVGLRVLLGMEPHAGKDRVLVLEDRELDEPFGLVVDDVGGVVNVPDGAMKSNPATLDRRAAALLDGVCRTGMGLMARLDIGRLQPLEAVRDAATRAEEAR
jgi:purine-binding chemotaxis protein CheW